MSEEFLTPKKIWIAVAIGVVVSLALIASTYEVRYIVSGSMDGEDQPYEIETIPVYSAVLIQKVDGGRMMEEFEIGDVIAFHYEGVVVVHRVVAKDPAAGTVTAHGDAMSALNTQTVTSDMVVGKVTDVSVTLGHIVHFLKTSTILLIAMIAVLIVAAYCVKDIVRECRRK